MNIEVKEIISENQSQSVLSGCKKEKKVVSRSLTSRNLLDKKPFRLLGIPDAGLSASIGEAERKGCWLIYGKEKNGKTWFAIQIARILAAGEYTVESKRKRKKAENNCQLSIVNCQLKKQKVAFISAEEGLDKSFTDACERAGVTPGDRILWDEYISIDEIIEKFKKPKSADIIIIDNLTIYADELKPSDIRKILLKELPNKLIIFLAHEEGNQPYTALARMAKKMSKVIFHVNGLQADITTRFGGKGGSFAINNDKSEIIWGEENN